jgi:acyl-CoA thioesterase I
MTFKQAIYTLAAAGFLLIGQAAAVSAEPYRIVGFGDSLMAGYGLGRGEGFPARLEAALRAKGYDVTVEDAGVSGDTTSGGLARLDWSVPDGTDLVILELGANDMLRGVSPKVTERNLDAMIRRLKARGMDVLLAGMLATPSLGPDYVAAFNAIYPRLARKHGVRLYPFFLEGVTGNQTMVLDDRMHPSAAGINRMVKGTLPMVEQFVRAGS